MRWRYRDRRSVASLALLAFCGPTSAASAQVATPPAELQPAITSDTDSPPTTPRYGDDIGRLSTSSHLVSASLSEVVGTAVSPLLGMGLIGSVGYFRAPVERRDALPWYNSPKFWIPILAILLLTVLKDTVGGAVPFLKKPLDALELVENKLSALVASPIVVQQFVDTIMRVTNDGAAVATAWQSIFPVAHAADNALRSAGGSFSLATQIVSAVGALTIFIVVFAFAHVVNVLVLLSPFGPLDVMLKASRVAVIGVLASAAALSPALGLVVCAIVIIVSALMFGWSFRFTTFGTVMAWDLLSRRSGDDRDGAIGSSHLAFATGLVAVAPRTLGALSTTSDGALEFVYRPFLILPRRRVGVASTADATLAVGSGTLSPSLIRSTADGQYRQLLRFSARFRGRETELSAALCLGQVRDISLGSGMRAALTWLRGLWTGVDGTLSPTTNGGVG